MLYSTIMQKLKIWNESTSWENAEAEWERGKKACAQSHPIKGLPTLPSIPGITEGAAKHLKYKSLKYLLSHDTEGVFWRNFLKHPFLYGKRWVQSVLQKKPYCREGDFFLYGMSTIQEFEKLLQEEKSLFVIGFSYCHKPFECPSGRFSDACIHDANHPVCRQCFIGKAVNALPSLPRIRPLFIPTVHYIGKKMFELVHAHPDQQIVFLITACELTLEMFGDWGNMIGIRGVGVRLDGRICNTMRAFELSEEGIKPGLTVVLEPTQQQILKWIRSLSLSGQNNHTTSETV